MSFPPSSLQGFLHILKRIGVEKEGEGEIAETSYKRSAGSGVWRERCGGAIQNEIVAGIHNMASEWNGRAKPHEAERNGQASGVRERRHVVRWWGGAIYETERLERNEVKREGAVKYFATWQGGLTLNSGGV